ncbi:MAG: hypothetical protein LUD15_09215, partial [Bacteroides sp.]|nr:hypothetical protein [Bacteroides sp.]
DIIAEGGEDGFNFDLGAMANTYYIDNVFVYEIEEEEVYEPIMILKTDEEKAEIIGEALQEWIYDMVTHFRDEVRV